MSNAIPTVQVKKGDAVAIINAVDLPSWKANGWSLVKDEPEGAKGKPKKDEPEG